MKQKRKSDVAVLLDYAGSHKGLTFLGLALSAVSMLLSMAPYICIWLAARDLIAVAPDWTAAQSVAQYGWLAFAFAVAGIILYFAGLMCTHLAAFRTASNIRKQGVAHVMKAPLGFFDANASGLIRGRLDAAAADTETLLAHNLADIVGTITLFVAMLVMMFVFDWRMGAACLLAAVISIVAMFSMNTRFTIEEENIVAIYAEDSRETTLENILAAMPYMDEDMRQLAAAAVNKLQAMTDSEFSEREFILTDEE